ncbi:secretin N-terminal domain-containing protein [Candidatus Zixiibacteriota bacterium]
MLTPKALCRTVALMMLLLLALTPLGGAQQERVIKSLTLQDADLPAVLRFLADFSGQNIVAGQGIEGSVDVQLQNVTWREALEIIMRMGHLTAVEEGGYIRVLPIEKLHQEELEQKRFEQEKQDLIQLEHRIFPVEHATAVEVQKALASVLSTRGRIDIDSRTNSLVVTDIPENLELVDGLVDSLDRKTPQITISTKLYEVDSKSLFEMGIDWTVIQDGRTGEQTTSGAVSEAIGTFTYSTMKDDIDLDALLSALVSDSKAEILAHPEITTLDNTTATILMGQEIPLKSLDESGNIITEMTQVGTKLTVTPHITSENSVLMKLEPERSSYEVDPGAGVIINTQRANTSVVVRDGQTAVIGGLTTQDTKRLEKGLPILKDIPLLGNLFRYTRDEVTKSDLIIFVTPHIVRDEE